MDEHIVITPHLRIPPSEVTFQFSRSGGKGGQNVNKVETKVELLFDVQASASLTEHQRQRLFAELSGRLDSSGILHIIAQESRSQWVNREIAISKFVEVIRAALRPVKKRVKMSMSKGAKLRRLEAKRRRSDVKKMRRASDRE